MQRITLDEASRRIKQAVDSARDGKRPSPFFFMVGAGISVPSVPLAAEIQRQCEEIARKHGHAMVAPVGSTPLDSYSFWLEQAFDDAIDRQRFFRNLIEGRQITEANLRLAHILLDGTISRIAVTTNFDDLLSRALDLFGKQHAVCDHPRTVTRIDLAADDVQVVHLHGSYWFYDFCNLKGEVADRSSPEATSVATMSAFLSQILLQRSPIVVGYSGWEDDVFMSRLRWRLKLEQPLPVNMYWFCHRSEDADELPDWVKNCANVRVVAQSDPRSEELAAVGESAQAAPLDGRPAGLEARSVFDALISHFAFVNPALTTNPLGFFAEQLEAALPSSDDDGSDIYTIADVIRRVREAAEADVARTAEDPLERARQAQRGSRYGEAISHLSALDMARLTPSELGKAARLALQSSLGLLDDSEAEVTGYALAVAYSDAAASTDKRSALKELDIAKALVYQALTLGQLERPEEELAAYEEVVRRFGEGNLAVLQKQVATALVYKALTLGQMKRPEEELAAYEEVVRRFGESALPALQEQVARALAYKALTLGQLDRPAEELAAYEEVVRRFGESSLAALQEQVARALVDKGFTLGQMKRPAEELAAYEEVVRRFGESTLPALQEQVARALVYKGCFALGRMKRPAEELAAYEEVVRRFGESTLPALQEQVARALVFKGLTLARMKRPEEALAADEEVIRRFGESTLPALQEQVASALVNKGFTLGQLERAAEELAAYEEVVRRFGDSALPALQEQVAKARRLTSEFGDNHSSGPAEAAVGAGD
jgi:SOS response regulatory protein OraA/RecX